MACYPVERVEPICLADQHRSSYGTRSAPTTFLMSGARSNVCDAPVRAALLPPLPPAARRVSSVASGTIVITGHTPSGTRHNVGPVYLLFSSMWPLRRPAPR